MKNIVKKLAVYILLIGISYAYIYPILYMTVLSFMKIDDLVNPSITWVGSELYTKNYKLAYETLKYIPALINTVYVSVVPAVLQTVSAALVGYGLARFKFAGKNLLIVFVIAAFLIPVQVTMIPKYIMINNFKLMQSELTIFLPALFGQGINSSVFILIFYRFFNSYPVALDEAAELDGCGNLKIFFKIALPMCVPAIIVSFIFSFIWYWNETYLSGMFIGEKIKTLPMMLSNFDKLFSTQYPVVEGSLGNRINESMSMAATNLTILPLIIMYLIIQRHFVESIDKTGVTGE